MIDRFHHVYIEPRDYEATLAFYRDTLGWNVARSWGGRGELRGAILSGGGMKLVVSEDTKHSGGRPMVHLDIHDIDERFKALPPGTKVIRSPEDTSWGTRWFVVEDPDGNRVAFEEVHRGR